MVLSNRCLAFYPLWPALSRILFSPQTIDQAAHSLLKLSTVIFFVSTPLLVWIFIKNLKHHYLAVLVLLAFSINPMAIFRAIGYTESLFSALSIIFIGLCLRQTRLPENLKLALVFCVTFIMSLTRPILIPFVFSSSALLGYSVYGIFCLQSRGDFFAPFNDQKNWGTKLGLHLELLLFPKSPLFDLLGLYFPILVLLIAFTLVYFKIKNKSTLVWVPKSPLWKVLLLYPPLLTFGYILTNLILKRKSTEVEHSLTRLNTSDFTLTLSSNYIFWFCVYFPVVHSALIFFTRDRLYSLGRYVFGVPFFFLALGYLCCCIPGKKTYQALWWFIIISAIALVEQWVNYGQNKWLG